jgi:activating signal cointegrator complex subunit 2
MPLPALAEVPSANIRLNIGPQEWEACLGSWITLCDLYLRAPEGELAEPKTRSSLASFLISFYHESAQREATDFTLHTAPALILRRRCFYLVKHLLIDLRFDVGILGVAFVTNFSRVHAQSKALPRLLKELWNRQDRSLQKLVEHQKVSMLISYDSKSGNDLLDQLRPLIDIFRASPEAGTLFMTGSDFLDALSSQYERTESIHERDILTATSYFGLMALVQTEPVNLSLLSDHLYSLKAQADKSSGQASLLADLVTNTPLTKKVRQKAGKQSSTRLLTLLDTADTYRSQNIAQPRHNVRRSKGKAKVMQGDGEMHMHRMSLVTQVQDLFLDLGSGFVLKLLDEYNDNVEQVTAHLLDDSLPPHLRGMDMTEQAQIYDVSEHAEIEGLIPRSTPPIQPYIPDRRNVFDDDDFDRLSFDTNRMHIGKKDRPQTETQPNKAAILSALAAFDSDDDERDDTYDVEDVGGTIDTAHPDGEPGPSAKITQEENDMALFSAYRSTPELFGRTFDVRRGQARQTLKAETGMTDEQIEGWATMLQRDPRRLKRLEAQSGGFDGKQTELGRIAYRESPVGTETEDSDAPADRGGFSSRGRGRGRGGRGRGGGNVAGSSSDPGTANAQRRKEASKGSRANHNRRDQRARKMARGGFAG